LKNYALTEIENTVQRSGKTLKQISGNASMVCRNVQQVGRRDELWSRSIKAGIVQLNQRWNDERKQIYYVVFESVEKQNFLKKKKVDCFWSKVMVALKKHIHGRQLLPNSTQMVKLCMQ
jgi:hypothetical protein